MGTAGAKAFGDMLLGNKTIQTLDVSDNSFGKVQKGDQVKIKSSGEMCTVLTAHPNLDCLELLKADGSTYAYGHKSGEGQSDIAFDPFGIPVFCAGVAASPTLISVSTILDIH